MVLAPFVENTVISQYEYLARLPNKLIIITINMSNHGHQYIPYCK